MKAALRVLLLLLLLLLLLVPSVQARWTFDGANWFWNGVRYVRVLDGKCGCYRWVRYVAPVSHSTQSSVVTSNDNRLVITNYYQVSQPAVAGGSTLYGYAGAAYSDLDLGALLAQYGRITEQGQAGSLQVAQSLGALVNGATALESERSKVAQILATGQAASLLARSVQPPPGPTAQIQAQIVQNGSATQQGAAGGLLGPLATQHCASCHTAGGATPSQKAIEKLDLDQELTPEGRLGAIRAMLLDDPDRRMPLNHPIDAQTLGLLLQELSQ